MALISTARSVGSAGTKPAGGRALHPAMVVLWIAVAALALLAPWLAYPVFVMKVLCFGLFAASFNLLLGQVGLLSFGHAAFFASSAYVAGWAVRDLGLSSELAILAGVAMAAVLGLLIGALAIRRKGIYFAMITLAMAQLVYFACVQLPVTGAEDGMHGLPRGHAFGLVDLSGDRTMYYFVLAVSTLGFFAYYRVINSPVGEVWRAIRENEPRMIALGYNPQGYKLLAFVISAALAGLAGGSKALVMQFATLTDAHWHMSGQVVLMTILGGVGTLTGPFVGSATINLLQTYLADRAPEWVTVIIGAMFIVCVLAFRKGIVGTVADLVRRRLPGASREQ